MKFTKVKSNAYYKYLQYQIGKLMLESIEYNNGYVAGGACRSWFENEEASDYDVFFTDEKSLESFKDDLFSDDYHWKEDLEEEFKDTYSIEFRSDNAITIRNRGTEAKIQIILIRTLPLKKQINVFDFTVCSVGYDLKKKKFFAHSQFFDDLHSKRLRINSANGELLYPLAEIERIARYSRKGYKIRGVDIVMVILFIAQRLEKINTYEDFKKEINGMDINLIDGIFEESELELDAEFNPMNLFDEINNYILNKQCGDSETSIFTNNELLELEKPINLSKEADELFS